MLSHNAEVVVVNGRFLELFNIPPGEIRPRMPMAELMDMAERKAPFGQENSRRHQTMGSRPGKREEIGKNGVPANRWTHFCDFS